jgi:hypothetical protein
VSADYSSWDQRYSTYRDNSNSQSELRKISTESDHSLSRIMTGVRYIVVEPAEFRLFLEGGIGYSYLRYNSYDIHLFNTPDGGTELLALSGRNADENLFNISTGIGLIHSLTNKFDILFEFKINTYLNAAYYGLYSSRGTFTGFNAGFNYKI